MGMKGPIPKREAERTRRNTTNESGESMVVTKGEALPVKWPRANPDWDQMAKDWYNGLKNSGMAAYYQQSDIALAVVIANELSIYLLNTGERRSSMMFQSIMAAMGGLGVTEGERRRMRIELEAPKEHEDPASVTAINDYKKRLQGKK